MKSKSFFVSLKGSWLALVGFLLMAGGDVCSQVRLPRLISDGMVLQRGVPVKLWGWASANEQISIQFHGRAYHTMADNEGKWSLLFEPMPAGGPYDMEIVALNRIRLKNILIGDVWVCSGQSNMVLPMDRVKDRYAVKIEHSENSLIRQYVVSTAYDFNASQPDLASGSWEAANPETVLHFTATGYFFAKTLFEKYHVPIGLINASVGGSPVQAWLSEDALKPFPEYLGQAEKFKDSRYRDSIKTSDSVVSTEWYANLWKNDTGLHETPTWLDTGYHANSWPTTHVPSYWKDNGLKDVHGVVWFRKEIELPGTMAGKPAKLLLGRIVDRDSVFVNGHFVGTTGYQYPPRKYSIAAGVLKAGRNEIIVRIINSWGAGGFVKDKPYQLIVDTKTIDLKGNWRYKLGVRAGPLVAPTFFQYQPLGLYNSMISPLLNYRIKGILWYQGEANTSKPREYRDLVASLIADWRQKWKLGNFPFLYVQLANYLETKNVPGESNWAELREAQFKTLDIPNTGMAITLDIGEWNDVHPLNKEDVGRRLALAAEKTAYGDSYAVSSGPLYQSMKVDSNKIIVSFTNTGGGLIAKEGGELKYFAIAGADKKFVWAKAKIDGKKVIAWNDSIKRPVALRYAWADNPEGANLYNKEGLPASSFRTDRW